MRHLLDSQIRNKKHTPRIYEVLIPIELFYSSNKVETITQNNGKPILANPGNKNRFGYPYEMSLIVQCCQYGFKTMNND